MGITVEWDDAEHTVIQMTHTGFWSNEEFRNAGLQSILMIRSVSHPVYLINDFRTNETLPLGILWQARNLGQMRPPNWGGAVIITSDTLVISVGESFAAVYMLINQRRNFYFARTKEEALAIIAKMKRDKQG